MAWRKTAEQLRPLGGTVIPQQNPNYDNGIDNDFLDFWSKAIPSLLVHPDDETALQANKHEFPLDTLVGPWMGPIRTAPVIIMTLNGGLVGNGEEAAAAKMPGARASMAHNLTGNAPLPTGKATRQDRSSGLCGLTPHRI